MDLYYFGGVGDSYSKRTPASDSAIPYEFSQTVDNTGNSYILGMGARKGLLGIEGGLVNLGKYKTNTHANDEAQKIDRQIVQQLQTTGLFAGPSLRIPLGKDSAIEGLGGVFGWKMDNEEYGDYNKTEPNAFRSQHKGLSPYVGLRYTKTLNDAAQLMADYRYYKDVGMMERTGQNNIHSLNLGLMFK